MSFSISKCFCAERRSCNLASQGGCQRDFGKYDENYCLMQARAPKFLRLGIVLWVLSRIEKVDRSPRALMKHESARGCDAFGDQENPL
jgi:hypothetical protein